MLVADALEVDWSEIFPYEDGIVAGNPPFLGKGRMDRSQLEQLMRIVGSRKVDYCLAWMEKASQWLRKGAYGFIVSSSACQGEQAEIAWRGAFNRGQRIFSAVKDFKWNGDANVHCSAFCVGNARTIRIGHLEDEEVEWKPTERICEYLLPVPNGVGFPIAKHRDLPQYVPKCHTGVKPIDDGLLLCNEEERNAMLAKEPQLERWLRPCIGAYGLLHGQDRWCIWVEPDKVEEALESSSFLRELDCHLQKARERMALSKRMVANKRLQFVQNLERKSARAVCIPKTFTNRHHWVPADFRPGSFIFLDSLHFIPDASMPCFGLLVSSLHHFWLDLAGGRPCMDYRYSEKCVWNTFPWLSQQELAYYGKKIEEASIDLLEARSHCNASLAEIYANLPREVELAHRKLDAVVLKAYEIPSDRDKWLEGLMARKTEPKIDQFF
jgi:hypothetical protein